MPPHMKGQRVLITGGLGFIGSNLAHSCLGLGAEVTVYDCLDPRSGGNMYNVRDIEDSIELICNDIRSFEGLSACVLQKDIVFNCAAYTSHPMSMKDPLTDINVNCTGVINLLEASRRFNPDIKIVHVGTSTQIGKMIRAPIDETHAEFPLDVYSANKSASEKYVLIYGSAYGMRTTVVRLANVFGPRSNIRSPDFGFMNYFVGLALQGRDLTVFGNGSHLRNVSYVEDATRALILASQAEQADGEVFFAVADVQHRIAEIAAAIVKVVGGRLRFMEWPPDRQAIEIGDAVISNRKIKDVLRWAPTVDLEAGLSKTKEYFAPCLEYYLG